MLNHPLQLKGLCPPLKSLSRPSRRSSAQGASKLLRSKAGWIRSPIVSLVFNPFQSSADRHGTSGVKDVERESLRYELGSKLMKLGIVEDARKALAEGRQPPLPIPGLPSGMPHDPLHLEEPISIIDQGQTALTAVPEYMRGSSTEAEPATPKWMTFSEAEETGEKANELIGPNESKQEVKNEHPPGNSNTYSVSVVYHV